MCYYSDPTAARALGSINREFSRYEKRAKQLCALYRAGKLSEEAWAQAHTQFRGIYRHVLDNTLKEMEKEDDFSSSSFFKTVFSPLLRPRTDGYRGRGNSLSCGAAPCDSPAR